MPFATILALRFVAPQFEALPFFPAHPSHCRSKRSFALRSSPCRAMPYSAWHPHALRPLLADPLLSCSVLAVPATPRRSFAVRGSPCLSGLDPCSPANPLPTTPFHCWAFREIRCAAFPCLPWTSHPDASLPFVPMHAHALRFSRCRANRSAADPCFPFQNNPAGALHSYPFLTNAFHSYPHPIPLRPLRTDPLLSTPQHSSRTVPFLCAPCLCYSLPPLPAGVSAGGGICRRAARSGSVMCRTMLWRRNAASMSARAVRSNSTRRRSLFITSASCR